MLISTIIWRGIAVAIVLVVLWLVARLVLSIASALIHLLLFVAALVIIFLGVRAAARRME